MLARESIKYLSHRRFVMFMDAREHDEGRRVVVFVFILSS